MMTLLNKQTQNNLLIIVPNILPVGSESQKIIV